jgi:hypothetical protein
VVYAGVDPIVLDLSGNGLHLTDVSSAAPRFDINGDGFAVKTGWVEPSTGILVLDKNGNGVIDNIGEMFGGPGLNGYAALAAYDTNGDGVIDANDAVFAQLQVWVDGNGNGVTDPGELRSLADLGITSISLDAQTQTDSFVAGNQVLETGTFTRSDGTTGALHVDNYDTRFQGDTTVTAAAAGLPNQKGYGTLTDLSVAVSHDPTGALAGVIAETLPTLNAIDLPTLLQRVTPTSPSCAARSPPAARWTAVTPPAMERLGATNPSRSRRPAARYQGQPSADTTHTNSATRWSRHVATFDRG